MTKKADTISVESYVSPKIVIGPSAIHGLGMVAARRIKRHEIVFIKGGHIVRRSEVWSPRPIESYLPIDDEFVIGALSPSEEPRIKLFLNHSCQPNCGLRGEVTFVAMRDIGEGEELTCDYAMIDNEQYEFDCACATALCRKHITGVDWTIEVLQVRYGEYFARYLQDKLRLRRTAGPPYGRE